MIKRLEARVKQNIKMNIQAFSGLEYVRGEWRLVPEGQEEAAKKHTLLDVREVGSEKEPAKVAPAASAGPHKVESAQVQDAEATEESAPVESTRKRTRRPAEE